MARGDADVPPAGLRAPFGRAAERRFDAPGRAARKMVEAGRIELPSETASIPSLRACPVFQSHHREGRRTGLPEDQQPRFVKTRAPGYSAPGRVCSSSLPRSADIGGSTSGLIIRPRERSYRSRLGFFLFFYEANRSPRRATGFSRAPSKPVAPSKRRPVSHRFAKSKPGFSRVDSTPPFFV